VSFKDLNSTDVSTANVP